MPDPDIFTLTISLGNDAMRTGTDIAQALRKVADVVFGIDPKTPDEGRIIDENGNTVGTWIVS